MIPKTVICSTLKAALHLFQLIPETICLTNFTSHYKSTQNKQKSHLTTVRKIFSPAKIVRENQIRSRGELAWLGRGAPGVRIVDSIRIENHSKLGRRGGNTHFSCFHSPWVSGRRDWRLLIVIEEFLFLLPENS